jgi:FtsH-binding integral membrane protein
MPPTEKSPRGAASRVERRVERVRRLLLRRVMPRLLMSLILAATGAAGFLVSFALLHAGVARMWLRYPSAVLCAYAVFLLLLQLWLYLRRHDLSDLLSDLDPTGVGRVVANAPPAEPDFSFGGGGDFGGGGAGGSWEGAGVVTSAPADLSGHAGSLGSHTGGGGGGGSGLLDGISLGDADEGCVFFLLAVALVVAGLLASLYVVYAAPTLLAELLVEGILLSGLYRGMRKGARRGDWLRAVVRRTWLPVLLTLTLFGAAGYLLQRAAPRARTIGEAFEAVRSR